MISTSPIFITGNLKGINVFSVYRILSSPSIHSVAAWVSLHRNLAELPRLHPVNLAGILIFAIYAWAQRSGFQYLQKVPYLHVAIAIVHKGMVRWVVLASNLQ